MDPNPTCTTRPTVEPERSSSAQEPPYLRQELTWAIGFGYKVITARRTRFVFIATQSIGSNLDNRKLNVHENEIGPAFLRHRYPFLAVEGLDHVEACIGEQIVENTPVVLAILDHQNLLAHAGLACTSTVAGSANAKIEP